MLSKDYKRIRCIADKLTVLLREIEETKYDRSLNYGNGLESEQLSCAVAALDCILQETDY